MIDQHTNFFKYVDNFAKTAHIPSISIFESILDKNPEITIAIPTYKRADLLKEALDSAINQVDYTNYDIIVVDNNPERGCETEKLMMSYNNPMLSYYKNSENIGMAGNWNRLFTLAKGKYVVMLHDDDLLLSFFLKEINILIYKIKKFGQIKPTDYVWRNNTNLSIKDIPILNGKIKKIHDLNYYSGNYTGVPSGVLFDKKKFIQCGGFNPEFHPTSDYFFNVLFAKKFRAFKVNKYLSIYRIADNESLNVVTLENFIINDFFLINQLLKEHHIPDFIVRIFLRYRSDRISLFYKSFYNSHFEFDIEKKLNVKKINRFAGIFCLLIIKLYNITHNLYHDLSKN